jgi:hypothetical protein
VRGVAFSVEKGPFSLPIFWAFVADASLRISLRYVPIFRRFIVGRASLLAFPIRRLQGLPVQALCSCLRTGGEEFLRSG